MATAAQTQRRPGNPARTEVKANLFVWEGTDRAGKKVRGEMRAASEAVVSNSLRRQSIKVFCRSEMECLPFSNHSRRATKRLTAGIIDCAFENSENSFCRDLRFRLAII